jgi:hypothetical protein
VTTPPPVVTQQHPEQARGDWVLNDYRNTTAARLRSGVAAFVEVLPVSGRGEGSGQSAQSPLDGAVWRPLLMMSVTVVRCASSGRCVRMWRPSEGAADQFGAGWVDATECPRTGPAGAEQEMV